MPRLRRTFLAALATVLIALPSCKKEAYANTPTLTSLEKSGSPNLRLAELPAIRKGEKIVQHMAYTLSYNTEHNTPNWVAWELTREEVNGNGRRANEFLPDPELEGKNQVTHQDYVGSGYDRGHMCPAGDNKWNAHAMTECFYLSNMCPQNHEFNSNSWETLERACRRWARNEGSVYIVCGPIYDKDRKLKTIGREHKVSVPNAFFKCVLSLKPGEEKAIGFVYQHNEEYQSMEQTALTVDAVEALTGYDFFCHIDKKVEKRVEESFNLKQWN